MGVKNILQRFAEETSIHGVAYMAMGSWKFKLFWAVMVLSGLCGLSVTVIEQLTSMLSYSTLIQQEVEIGSELPFPGVTICNFNYFKKSEVTNFPGFHSYLLSIDDTSEQNTTGGLFTLRFTQSDVENVLQTTPSLEETFLGCYWMSREWDCGELFQRRMTDFGMCFTFNTRASGLNSSLVSKRAGENDGLVVMLDVRQSEYVPSHSVSAGFHVVLHDFHETPFLHKGFTVSPGFSYTARLNLREVTYLPAPYKAYADTTCEDSSERITLKYFPYYDIGACYSECKIDFIIEACGCKTVFDPDSVPVPYCSPSELLNCYSEYEDIFWTERGLKESCPCPPYCHQLLFDTSLSMSYYPSEAFFEQENLTYTNGGGLDDYRKNVLQLRLFYDHFLFDKVTQVPKHTFGSISATLGGQMGLYLGVSLLSAVELVFMLSKCTWTLLAKLMAKDGRNKTAVAGVSLEEL